MTQQQHADTLIYEAASDPDWFNSYYVIRLASDDERWRVSSSLMTAIRIRLKALTDDGVLERKPNPDRPREYLYRLRPTTGAVS